ncbi:hypothetical protein DB346_00395 [Verrucomicrobia bacterium LW23]|nr:hypothetical protein DB346_00395 [Verrucomicrobia bacterium LW23]
MKPIVIHAKTPAELEERLARHTSSGHRYSLAITFAADSLIEPALLEPFAKRGIAVFGGASEEEIAGGDLSRGSLAAMLLDIDPELFRLEIFPQGEGRELGGCIARRAREHFSNPVVLMLVGGAGLTIDVDELLAGMFAAEPGLPTFGGLTSSDRFQMTPPIFSATAIHEQGVNVLYFDNDSIDLRGVAISGWKEIGTPKRITRAEGNVVFEIENEPAADFYKRYFKVKPGEFDEILEVSEYPLLLERADGSKAMRTAIQVEGRQRAVHFGGNIPQGALVRFCSPNIVETIKHTVEQLQAFRSGTLETPVTGDAVDLASVDAVILFDCAIRSRSFGPYMSREIQVIRKLWDVPLVGFSSWGEIGNMPGRPCGLHNTVISTVLIREKGRQADGRPPVEYTDEQVEHLIDDFAAGATVESLKRDLTQIRKQKTMLSHFLHLTYDDLERERQRSDELLRNILPAPVADRLKGGERTIADSVDAATILFADIVGFTVLSSRMSASELVQILNQLFSLFDELAHECGVEKIKTIGDAYMAVAGVPEPHEDHAERALRLALGLLTIIQNFNEANGTELDLRIGLNTGPVVAGVIGKRKFSYDLWGDAVNTASRMESHGLPGRIHLSESTYRLLEHAHTFESRGKIEIKDKGGMNTYLYSHSNAGQ